MLTFAAVVTKTGVVLWSSSTGSNASTLTERDIIEAVNALLVDEILEDKNAGRHATQANGRRELHWAFDQTYQLICIVLLPSKA